MHILAVIPARGGSKRLPRKNLLPLSGMPLIGWSIEAAKKSKWISQVLVSTEDAEIAAFSRSAGVEVHTRPASLAADETPSLPVLQDAVASCTQKPDLVVLLQPTSPFRTAETIDQGIAMMREPDADALISVSRSKFGPEWLLKIQQGWLSPPDPEALSRSRTQDMQMRYQINGALYLYRYDTLMLAKDYAFGRKTLALELHSPEDWDIDTHEDFKIAQAIANEFNLHW